jgi:hypothetical protein
MFQSSHTIKSPVNWWYRQLWYVTNMLENTHYMSVHRESSSIFEQTSTKHPHDIIGLFAFHDVSTAFEQSLVLFHLPKLMRNHFLPSTKPNI